MNKLFTPFFKRNITFAKLAIISNLEYRMNFLTDALIQPILTCGVELMLWNAIFTHGTGRDSFAGYSKEAYFSYVLWAVFIGRIAVNWMYENRMMSCIERGELNTILLRPISFYEVYFSQFFAYKSLIAGISLLFPLGISFYYGLPIIYSRLPEMLLMLAVYIWFCYSMSFIVSTLSFFFTKANSFSFIKNITLTFFTGELFPLDLLPVHLKKIFLQLPFPCAIYAPVGYLSGRIDSSLFYQCFGRLFIGLAVTHTIGYYLWKRGLREYAGTGA